MRDVVGSIEGEFRRYKALGEGALDQLRENDLRTRFAGGNSVAILVQHIGGNLKSRFTDFLTSDGEKPWRDRDSEFADRDATRQELLDQWQEGWSRLLDALSDLSDDQLGSAVSIRGVSLTVLEAFHRSLAHTSYHVGQIVLIAREIRGAEWRFLSIPPGASAAYNQNPKWEKPPR